MAVEINQSKIFTVKYLDRDGQTLFVDIPALGAGDAQDKFREMAPEGRIVNCFQKQ